MTDLEIIFTAIQNKTLMYKVAWDYYYGEQPAVYAASRLREVFNDANLTHFQENWCAVVIEALTERVQLAGFTVPTAYQERVNLLFTQNELQIESDDLHDAVFVTGEGYIIVDDNEGVPEIYYNDPARCHMLYNPERAREPRAGGKYWTDELKNKAYLNLYYPDRTERYIANRADPTSASAFRPMGEPVPNRYNLLPIIRFIGRKHGISEIKNVVPVQDAINKLLTDMMVAAEFGAFNQRWVISNADVTTLRNSPNEIWSIPAGDGLGQGSSVGQFASTDLGNYLDSINMLAVHIAAVTRTPKHYFMGTTGEPSGEALIAMEAPINKKAQNRAERLEVAWRRVIQYALRVTGVSLGTDEITAIWQPVETVQPKTEAEVRRLDIDSGIPLITSLKRAGWTDTEIEQMEIDKEAEAQAGANIGQELLRNFEAGR